MSERYTIRPLAMGSARVPAAEVAWMTTLAGWTRLTFWAVLIEGPRRKILLNSGFPPDLARLREHWTGWARAATGEEGHVPEVGPENGLTAALARHGVKPEEITDVLVTPLTAYATGGLDLLTGAQFWLSRRGWIDFHAPDPEMPQLPRDVVFPPHILRYLVMEAPSRLHLLEDEPGEFLPGIRAWFCGGHHRSSMAFVVSTAESGQVALTDAVFTYRNVEENIPLGLSESLEEHYRLYARLKREANLVIPLYDPAVADRHPALLIT